MPTTEEDTPGEQPVEPLDQVISEACALSEGEKTILILDQLQLAPFVQHLRIADFLNTSVWSYADLHLSAHYVNLMLFLTATTFNIQAFIGVIMLAGIVVNNAIVLVEQIEICRQQGLQLIEAVMEASSLRLRPILMTTLTSVFGMLPLAAGLNEGSEMLQPLATVIVFGLSFSLLVSLLIIPIFYLLIHRREAPSHAVA